MSSGVDGILAYGFDLGGADGLWHLQGVEKHEAWVPSWVGEDLHGEIEDGTFDYQTAIHGWLEHHDMEGIVVISYGMLDSDDHVGLLLAAWRTGASGACTATYSPADIAARREIERWDTRLAVALEHLDIRPLQPHPMMLITQSYG